MFAGLLAWAKLSPSPLTVLSVRLRVDAGLLLIIQAIGKPFTLQYARERVPEERWKSPRFARINFVITSVWAQIELSRAKEEASALLTIQPQKSNSRVLNSTQATSRQYEDSTPDPRIVLT